MAPLKPRITTATATPGNGTKGCPMADPIMIPDATTEPEAYVAALLRTLGDRDPLVVYEQTSDEVRRHCQDLDRDSWTTPMADGEWSALQLVGHLFDVDVVYGFRWRLALTEDTPAYPGYNEYAASTSATYADVVSTANRGVRTSNA